MPEEFSMVFHWLAATTVLAVFLDRVSLWLIPYVVSARVVAGICRRAGGVNRLVFHGLNNAENCRTPLATADALMTLCPYDISDGPLKLNVTIPEDSYWSVSAFAANTDNIYAINDRQLELDTNRTVTFVFRSLTDKGPKENAPTKKGDIEVPLKAVRGMILLRLAVPDPLDDEAVAKLAAVQRESIVEHAATGKHAAELIRPSD